MLRRAIRKHPDGPLRPFGAAGPNNQRLLREKSPGLSDDLDGPGDSGRALRLGDQVPGFAFENSAPDDMPQFTDWIWAANALHAMDLTPETLP